MIDYQTTNIVNEILRLNLKSKEGFEALTRLIGKLQDDAVSLRLEELKPYEEMQVKLGKQADHIAYLEKVRITAQELLNAINNAHDISTILECQDALAEILKSCLPLP